MPSYLNGVITPTVDALALVATKLGKTDFANLGNYDSRLLTMLSAFNANATDRLPKPTHLNEQKGSGNITPRSTVHPRCLRRASFKERRGGRINERELGSLLYSENECTLTYYGLVIMSTNPHSHGLPRSCAVVPAPPVCWIMFRAGERAVLGYHSLTGLIPNKQ